MPGLTIFLTGGLDATFDVFVVVAVGLVVRVAVLGVAFLTVDDGGAVFDLVNVGSLETGGVALVFCLDGATATFLPALRAEGAGLVVCDLTAGLTAGF